MTDEIYIQEYFEQYALFPIVDVRSPGEYARGHIPGAVNIPLFSDVERADIGTIYKHEGKDKAIEKGYKYVNPKLDFFIQKSHEIAPDKKIVVHCWRGGMRSHSFADLLAENGFDEVKVIIKGYKSFRNMVLSSFDADVDLKVIGGYTGSGKTHILRELHGLGCQVIDLEGFANHKGSAFGAIGENNQPSIEQFENDLFMQWRKLDLNQPVYIEDESHNIGAVKLPMNLYNKIRGSKVYFLEIPKEKRAALLVNDYASFNNELLKEGVLKISKRLGGLVTQLAIDALDRNDYFQVAMFTLNYYDKSYMRGVLRRSKESIIKIQLPDVNADYNAEYIRKFVGSNHHQKKEVES